MLINEHKTIGVLINKIDEFFLKVTYRALQDKAQEYGYNLVIFNSYINAVSDRLYDNMEEKILDFVPIDELDGVIVIPDSYGDSHIQKYLETILCYHPQIPCVYIRSINDKFHCVGTNETEAIRCVIRHFIYDHHFTKICFMGGTPGHADAQYRLQCYLDEMKKANLELMPNAIYHGNFWWTCGEDAAKFFTSNPDELPEAVICANDYMALALCDSLKEMGYRIPQDICISGYDDTKLAQDYNPSITTVSIDFTKMSEKAMDILNDMIHGENPEKIHYLEPTLKLRASCGCGIQEEKTVAHNMSAMAQTAILNVKQIRYNYFSVDMDSCQSMNAMYSILTRALSEIEGIQKFYLCLFGHTDEKNEIDFTSHPLRESTLCYAYEYGKDLGVPFTRFSSKKILPDIIRADDIDVYYVTLLHNNINFFGYTVSSFDPEQTFDVFFHSWHITLGITIDEIYSKIRIRNLMSQIEKQSIIDSLTGIYNRRGFEIMVEKNWGATLNAGGKAVFIGIDLDRLKYVNDNYGHAEGDFSICVIADALKEAASKTNAVYGRMGGDEFAAVIFMGEEETAQSFEMIFRKYIEKANESAGKEYCIDASLGYYITTITSDVRYANCMRESDKALYLMKRLRKIP